MAERLGLGLRGGGSSEGCLGLSGRRGAGEQVDLLRDGAAQVVEGLADVGWVVVGFVGVLRARQSDQAQRREAGVVRDLQHRGVHLLQRIHALLQLDVVRGELGLPCPCQHCAGDAHRAGRTLSSTLPTCSLTYCCVLAAHGVKEALQKQCQHIAGFHLAVAAGPGIRDVLSKRRDLAEVIHGGWFVW